MNQNTNGFFSLKQIKFGSSTVTIDSEGQAAITMDVSKVYANDAAAAVGTPVVNVGEPYIKTGGGLFIRLT